MSNIAIDYVGTASTNWKLQDFIQYYERNKTELDKIHSHRINTHVKIYDDEGNEYKVIRRKGKTIITRTSNMDRYQKRDMLIELQKLAAKLEELQRLIDKKAEDEPDDQEFMFQNEKPLKRYKI